MLTLVMEWLGLGLKWTILLSQRLACLSSLVAIYTTAEFEHLQNIVIVPAIFMTMDLFNEAYHSFSL